MRATCTGLAIAAAFVAFIVVDLVRTATKYDELRKRY